MAASAVRPNLDDHYFLRGDFGDAAIEPADEVFLPRRTHVASGEASAASVTALGLYPLGSFDVFVHGGFSHWRSRHEVRSGSQVVTANDSSDTEATYGAGLQFQARRVLTRLEYQRLHLGTEEAGVTSLGFAWAF